MASLIGAAAAGASVPKLEFVFFMAAVTDFDGWSFTKLCGNWPRCLCGTGSVTKKAHTSGGAWTLRMACGVHIQVCQQRCVARRADKGGDEGDGQDGSMDRLAGLT